MKKKLTLNKYHRFLDEAGDTTFYGKGKINIIGTQGVSKCFILGMVKFSEPLKIIRNKVIELQMQIASDPYYKKKECYYTPENKLSAINKISPLIH